MARRRRYYRRKKSRKSIKIVIKSSVMREVSAVFYLCLGILIILAILGKGGPFGTAFISYMRFVFGKGIILFPIVLIFMAGIVFFTKNIRFHSSKTLGLFLFLCSSLGLYHLYTTPLAETGENIENFGGAVGFVSSFFFRRFIFGDTATFVILGGILIVSIVLIFEVSIAKIGKLFRPQFSLIDFLVKKKKERELRKKSELNIIKPDFTNHKISAKNVFNETEKGKKEEKTLNNTAKASPRNTRKNDFKIKETAEIISSSWEFPSVDILDKAKSAVFTDDEFLKSNAQIIKRKLSQFGIEVTMKDIHVGPTVTQYSLLPHEGVKLTKITALKNDLALALAASAIRIEAPIPGKSLVGIETPNKKRIIVSMREMLESEEWMNMKGKMNLPIGRDVSGKPIIKPLEKMPHILIAGRTGSGKSVCMNAFLIALLFRNSPSDLKFIMIDPKRVELTKYNGIPHLLSPVITAPEKALSALKWAVAEMSRRYHELSEKGYRDINEYNWQEPKKMYRIVIVVDELADLMMQSTRRDTEGFICRIAQMARAVGIHLIIATQRPSVNVITGLIKANIATRIAFGVAAGVDSRTIIDQVGAEDLLGAGDMLYLAGDAMTPIRIQGVFISTKEVEKISNKIKLTSENGSEIEGAMIEEEEEEKKTINFDKEVAAQEDELYPAALGVIKETGKASASLLQRRLKVGYARAARLLDILEAKGIVGPVAGAKPREIYIDRVNQ